MVGPHHTPLGTYGAPMAATDGSRLRQPANCFPPTHNFSESC